MRNLLNSHPQLFWLNVDICSRDDCWLWLGSTYPSGRGYIRFRGKTYLAHRLACTLAVEEIPKGGQICHHCDNPPCCNPNHLFLGTAQDNTDDMMRKGRHKWLIKAKVTLTDEQKNEIRSLYLAGKAKYKYLARKFGVDWSTIREIINNT